MENADDRTILAAAVEALAPRECAPSLLSRVMAVGADLATAGKLSKPVIDEVPGNYALCLIQKHGEVIRELSGVCRLVVGRTPGDSEPGWMIEDNWMSKEHFRLAIDEDGFASLEDLASKNGVWVNDVPVAGTRLLVRGDCIRAGHSTFLLL